MYTVIRHAITHLNILRRAFYICVIWNFEVYRLLYCIQGIIMNWELGTDTQQPATSPQ